MFGLYRLIMAGKGFINLNDAAVPAHNVEFAGTHGFAQTVGYKPGRLVSDFQHLMQLVRADTFLAGHHQERGLKPFVERDMAGLEHRPILTVNCFRQ